MTHEPPQYPDYGSVPGQGAGTPPTPPPPPGAGGYGPPSVPPPGYYGAPGGYLIPPPVSQKAVWSMVLGIVGLALLLVCCGLFGLTIIPGVIAIILSRMAKDEIARSGGALTGQGQATAGFVTGIITVALSVAAIIFFVGLFVLDGTSDF